MFVGRVCGFLLRLDFECGYVFFRYNYLIYNIREMDYLFFLRRLSRNRLLVCCEEIIVEYIGK